MPGEKLLQELAEVFSVLGDRTRICILQALSATELCVCDLSELLSITPSAVSHQLRILRAARLVKYRRQGRQAFYSLDDDHVDTLMRQGIAHLQE